MSPLKLKRLVALGALLAGALLVLALSYYIPAGFWRSFVEHGATATIIASLLGLTADFWFKREIAEDVFRAATGYFLPPFLREEVEGLFATRVVGDLDVHLDIAPTGANDVRVTVAMTRTLEVVGDRVETVPLTFGVDEWFGTEPSQILIYEYQLDGETTSLLEYLEKRPADRQPGWRVIGPKPVLLNKGQKLVVRMRYVEMKRRNDVHFIAFHLAVRNPRIRVTADSSLQWVPAFAHRRKVDHDKFSQTATLNATLLPHQWIMVHWWDVAAGEKWREQPTKLKEGGPLVT